MHVIPSTDEAQWEAFLLSQPCSPFLQSFAMGEVYRRCGDPPVRLELRDGGRIVGVCQAVVVSAKRGRHLSVPYGPVIGEFQDPNPKIQEEALGPLVEELRRIAAEHSCSFIRLSPFWPVGDQTTTERLALLRDLGFRPSPLHLLAEHVWILDLQGRHEEGLLMTMRATTRNLIRRAEREGVVVAASQKPQRDFTHFWRLHQETVTRHGFTPYPEAFLRSELDVLGARGQASLYLARYNDEVIAASIHIHYDGQTSYHHGASSSRHEKIPGSYLLQWAAIKDALHRGDRIYNFWGVAPLTTDSLPATSYKLQARRHPFAGVTMFKTGFGGRLLQLPHCMDLPLTRTYVLTWGVETLRRVRRGF